MRSRGGFRAVNSERVRVGVIGVGHLGEYHLQKYKAMPQVQLVGIVDTDPKRSDEIAHRYGVRAFDHHRSILDHVDCVSLAVPTEDHFEVSRDILSKGIHLLVEKPITYNLEHADTLIRMAREKGLVLQVGHVERFNPAVMKMETLLTRPIFIESHRLNLFTTRGTDVDVVLDLMIHDLDIILHIVPSEVKEVHAIGMSVITRKTDIANVRIIFENGTVANLTASRVSNRTLRKIRLFQPDTYISVDCVKREISVTRLNGHTTDPGATFPHIQSNRTNYPNSDPLADQISSFVGSVAEGTQPLVSGLDGRRALQVASAIIDQIERGCKHFTAIS
jgi:predicted dehydrogenase